MNDASRAVIAGASISAATWVLRAAGAARSVDATLIRRA